MGSDVTAVPGRLPSALQTIRARGRLRAALALFGPAFVASVAYVDTSTTASPGWRLTAVQIGRTQAL